MPQQVLSTITLFKLRLVVSSVPKFTDYLLKVVTNRPRQIGGPVAVMVVSMQDIMARQWQPKTRAAFQSFDYFTMDGMPLVWLARIAGWSAERIYGPDVLEAMLAKTQTSGSSPASKTTQLAKSLTHYFYGGTPAMLSALCQTVQSRWPGVKIAGSMAPPFRPLTQPELIKNIAKINATQPDIVWVGLGSWKQLDWVNQAKPYLKTRLIIPVGMAFDLLAGTKQQAPRWVQRAGLEWLFRLLQEPGRLWQRYVFSGPIFAIWWLVEAGRVIWQRCLSRH